eukprot:PhF_6_TR2295/c0_g1_i2/m.4015
MAGTPFALTSKTCSSTVCRSTSLSWVVFFFRVADYTKDGFVGRKLRVPVFQLSESFIRQYGVDREEATNVPKTSKPIRTAHVAEELHTTKDAVRYLIEDIICYVGEMAVSSPDIVLSLNFGFCTVFFKSRTTMVQFSQHFIVRLFEVDTCKWCSETKEVLRHRLKFPHSSEVQRQVPFPCLLNPREECPVCDDVSKALPPRASTPSVHRTPTPSARPAQHPVTFMPGSAVPRSFDDIAKRGAAVPATPPVIVNANANKPKVPTRADLRKQRAVVRPLSSGGQKVPNSARTESILNDPEACAEEVSGLVEEDHNDEDYIPQSSGVPSPTMCAPVPIPMNPRRTTPGDQKPLSHQNPNVTSPPSSSIPCDFLGSLMRDEKAELRKERAVAKANFEYNQQIAQQKKQAVKSEMSVERRTAKELAEEECLEMERREVESQDKRKARHVALKEAWNTEQQHKKVGVKNSSDGHYAVGMELDPFFNNRVNTPTTRRVL